MAVGGRPLDEDDGPTTTGINTSAGVGRTSGRTASRSTVSLKRIRVPETADRGG
jgi:hypothetical protein